MIACAIPFRVPGLPLEQRMDVRLSTFLVVHQILLDSGHDSLWDSPAAVLESFGSFFCCKVPFHSKAWKRFGNFGQRDGGISREAFPPHLQTAGCSPAPPVRASVLRRRHEGSFWLGRAGILICSRLFGSTWILVWLRAVLPWQQALRPCFSGEEFPLEKLQRQRSQPRQERVLPSLLVISSEEFLISVVFLSPPKLQCLLGGVPFSLGNAGKTSLGTRRRRKWHRASKYVSSREAAPSSFKWQMQHP